MFTGLAFLKNCRNIPKTLGIELSFDSATPLIVIYTKDTKIKCWKGICTPNVSFSTKSGNSQSLEIAEVPKRDEKQWYTQWNITWQ